MVLFALSEPRKLCGQLWLHFRLFMWLTARDFDNSAWKMLTFSRLAYLKHIAFTMVCTVKYNKCNTALTAAVLLGDANLTMWNVDTGCRIITSILAFTSCAWQPLKSKIDSTIIGDCTLNVKLGIQK